LDCLFLKLLETFEFKKTTPVFFIFFIVKFCEKHLLTLIFLDIRLTYKRSGSDASWTPSDDLGPKNVLQTYKKCNQEIKILEFPKKEIIVRWGPMRALVWYNSYLIWMSQSKVISDERFWKNGVPTDRFSSLKLLSDPLFLLFFSKNSTLLYHKKSFSPLSGYFLLRKFHPHKGH